MVQQFAFDFGNAPIPRLENFIGHPDVVMALTQLLKYPGTDSNFSSKVEREGERVGQTTGLTQRQYDLRSVVPGNQHSGVDHNDLLPLRRFAGSDVSAGQYGEEPHSEVDKVMRMKRNWNDLGSRSMYLFGASGSGRSHLLAASCAAVQSCGGVSCSLGATSLIRDFAYFPEVTLYTVDDVDQLDEMGQIALFNLFNQIQSDQILLCAGIEAPLGLRVREDLRTRLGWGLVFRLTSLDDEQKIMAFTQAAQERGFNVSAEVPNWLIKHYRRDLNSMMGLLDALDQFSLEKKRPVTLPLMRELLAVLRKS